MSNTTSPRPSRQQLLHLVFGGELDLARRHRVPRSRQARHRRHLSELRRGPQGLEGRCADDRRQRADALLHRPYASAARSRDGHAACQVVTQPSARSTRADRALHERRPAEQARRPPGPRSRSTSRTRGLLAAVLRRLGVAAPAQLAAGAGAVGAARGRDAALSADHPRSSFDTLDEGQTRVACAGCSPRSSPRRCCAASCSTCRRSPATASSRASRPTSSSARSAISSTPTTSG